jgi:phosphatidylserine/phosphatidylglycerophosphate/cardiolipin synthase-like enzyme
MQRGREWKKLSVIQDRATIVPKTDLYIERILNQKENSMSFNLKVYDNGDHACLVWLPADGKPIAGCRGFAIRRILNGQESYLHGFVGFTDKDVLDVKNPWKFPVQRYMWWDYGVRPGDKVQYSVVPVVGDKDHLDLAQTEASPLSKSMTVTGQDSDHVAAYFNKGIVAAQWVARALEKIGAKAKLKDQIGKPGNQLRNALGGLLREQVLKLLADAADAGGDVYLALYELNDPELIDGLKKLGHKCHLLLANGAFNSKKPDENKAVRKELRRIVNVYDRLVSSGHFAHNKFAVFCDQSGKPQSVLTGSTNWTMTGLCTQANNGLIINDPVLAQYFLDEWNLLKQAGNSYPKSLATANSRLQSFKLDGVQVTQWFVPTTAGQDLVYARKLIGGAKDGILFLFFNPGKLAPKNTPAKWTLLQNILARHDTSSADYDPDLYVRGVVNQEIAGLTSPAESGATKNGGKKAAADHPVTLFSGRDRPPQHLTHESMVPKNIKSVFHNWEEEMLGTGVHIHSKVIVIDPFGKHPVVMTGSHNLGFKASSKNDDNLAIVEGNAELAAAYAVNIIAIYQSYRWNSYVEAHRQDPNVWHGLVDNDQWQQSYLEGPQLDELNFWMGLPRAGSTATTGTSRPSHRAKPARKSSGSRAAKPASRAKPPARKKAAAKKRPAAKRKKRSSRS